jgi:hypothetical protein
MYVEDDTMVKSIISYDYLVSGKILLGARNSAFKITPLILNRWSARPMIGA